jgi:hypothetical protein
MSLYDPKIKLMNWFVKFITFGWAIGITLAPFGIYFKKKQQLSNKVDINHEKIHWHQQLEMLIIFFYIWYLVEWLIKIILPPWKKSYYRISYEREAYIHEYDLDYLKTRKHFAWLKYVFHGKQ